MSTRAQSPISLYRLNSNGMEALGLATSPPCTTRGLVRLRSRSSLTSDLVAKPVRDLFNLQMISGFHRIRVVVDKSMDSHMWSSQSRVMVDREPPPKFGARVSVCSGSGVERTDCVLCSVSVHDRVEDRIESTCPR